MEVWIEYLPMIMPLALAQFVLAITALVHVLKHPVYRFGSKGMWIFIVLLVQPFGAIVYFIFGRGEE